MKQPSLEAEIGRLLRRRGSMLSVAESCTGGLLAHRITNVDGSSEWFAGGVVSYSNDAKRQLLGVSASTLEAHGAVSCETAKEMAQGARRLFGADIALSITGIAGPSGGTSLKPVGLVFLHLSSIDSELAERHVWAGNRVQNKEQSAEAALLLLLRYLRSDRVGQ